MIGKFIDGLSDEQRDRIIEHPDPTYSGWNWWDAERNCGCLVGCVVGREYDGIPGRLPLAERRAYGVSDAWLWVGMIFPRLTYRFGAPRIWRLVKARAAKANRVTLPEPSRTPEAATA